MNLLKNECRAEQMILNSNIWENLTEKEALKSSLIGYPAITRRARKRIYLKVQINKNRVENYGKELNYLG